MDFLTELLRWFWGARPAKNDPISQPVSNTAPEPVKIVEEIPPAEQQDLDLMPSLTGKDVLYDLQSLQSQTQQIDRARKDLIVELQRLAPPKKRNPFWEKDAA